MSERESTLDALRKIGESTMCMTENQIHQQRAKRNLRNEDIAALMAAELGENVSPESVGHYFTENSGIKIGKIGAFLRSLGLKVVQEDAICVTPDKLAALKTLAAEALTRDCSKD